MQGRINEIFDDRKEFVSMRKILSEILVATLCCFAALGDIEKVNAETGASNYELTESKKDMTNMLYYTEAESGETAVIDMTEIMDEMDELEDENRDLFSRGNMSDLSRVIIWDEDDEDEDDADERGPVDNANTYPYSAIALVEVVYTNGDTDYGTGYFVSRRTMLTAAHVLVKDNLQIERINVYKACNGYATTPTAQASAWYICANYDDSASSDYDDDYAILRFSSNVSQTWFGLYVPADASNLLGSGRHVAGYPYDMSDKRNREYYMCTAGGSVVDYHLYRIDHKIDTLNGESGAPVFRYNYSLYQWEAIAIHLGGQSTNTLGGPVGINYGRRITSDLYNWLLNNSFISA